jgi:hypothetical protein
MAHYKTTLPEKTCVACRRTMAWRKAWAKNWAEVKYCSDRCRTDAKRNPAHATGRASQNA